MENRVERTFQVRYIIKIDENTIIHSFGHRGPIPLYKIYLK